MLSGGTKEENSEKRVEGPLLFLAGYGAVFLGGAAVVAWAILARRVRSRTAALLASMIWLVAFAPPLVGLAIDEMRQPVTCSVGDECPAYVLWYLGIPVGWVLGFLVTGVTLMLSRDGSRRKSRP
jgi:hypothetical protein